jgi:glycosyltransferase involved in cell wall biosynthesis
MKEPAISIIIPVYNVEKYLKGCLDSIFKQTFSDFEMICIDDGSTDSSGKMLDEISSTHPNMQVFHTENAGISSARNFGLSKAQGKYVVFIDSDDSIVPNYLEALFEEIEHSGADIAACQRKMVPEIASWEKVEISPEKIQHITGDITGQFLSKKFKLGVEAVGKMWRRGLLPQAPFVPGLIYEDYCFFYTRYFKDLTRLSIINEDLYMITRSENSIMRSSFSEKKLLSFFKILREIKTHIENFDPIYHKKIFRRTHNNMIHRLLRELLRMPDNNQKEDFFLKFKEHFKAGLQDGSIQISHLKLKYKLLAICVISVKNMHFFQTAAKLLF